eukprot:CAMPEP_0177649086 /NCGR_PEP_ID=MMETSP0447-20121125/11179_1 /TAXON_ID=0 /ORGANISM="Stygamoeba regulata, Strain BSH-02190019" /LENGTH=231 /DNA_ID=CAMNT_0019151781 /DNA_START=137 /DNA_END=832 /DNA_ORIENTATION=+
MFVRSRVILPAAARLVAPRRTYVVQATVQQATDTKNHPFIADPLASQIYRHWNYVDREDSAVIKLMSEVLTHQDELVKSGIATAAEMKALSDEFARQDEGDARAKLALAILQGKVALPENPTVTKITKHQKAGTLDSLNAKEVIAAYEADEAEMRKRAEAAGGLQAELQAAASSVVDPVGGWIDDGNLKKMINDLSPKLKAKFDALDVALEFNNVQKSTTTTTTTTTTAKK